MLLETAVEKTDKLGQRRPFDIAGINFDLIDTQSILQTICRWRNNGHRGYISLINPHYVMLCHRDAAMKAAVQGSSLTLPDGIGIVLGAMLLSQSHGGRLAGPEVMLSLCDEGRRCGLTHYFYGGAAGVPEGIVEKLRSRYVGLQVAGVYSPPFRELTEDEDRAITAKINEAKPDIVWVGLGTAKQEKWMASHEGKIAATAMIGVGAAFDFHSGNKAWCPQLLRRIGLEWAHRLLCEPRRLWRRNIDNPLFLGVVACQILKTMTHRAKPKELPSLRKRDEQNVQS